MSVIPDFFKMEYHCLVQEKSLHVLFFEFYGQYGGIL